MIATLSASEESSMASAMSPHLLKHPNKLAFFGTLTIIDTLSDRPPSGARGHRVMLTRGAVEGAIHTLPGMAINCEAQWNTHNARRKFGIITAAEIKKNKLLVGGYIYAHDFPDVESILRGRDLGMSYEATDCHVEDMNAEKWKIIRIGAFTGAAVLDRLKAAYRNTRFELA